MLRADRDMLEDEVEASIARANAECEAESGARTGRMSCAKPNLSNPCTEVVPSWESVRLRQWFTWFGTSAFARDIAGCAETNS